MRIFWDNLIDTATVTASSEEEDYEIEHIQHIWKKRTWRSTGNSSETIYITLTSAEDAKALILYNHNIPLSATVHIKGNTVNNEATAVLDETVTVTSEKLIHYFAGGAQNYTYWWITIDYASSSSGNYFEIGRVFLGDYYEFDYQYASINHGFVDPSPKVYSDDGQLAADRRDSHKWFLFAWSVGAITEAALNTLYTIFEEVGQSVPFFIEYDPSNITAPGSLYYVEASEDWEFEPLVFKRYGFNLLCQESR